MSEQKNSKQIVKRKIGNTKQSSANLRWAFTLNNYDDQDIEYLCILFNRWKALYVFGEEVSETGTPHLQGQVTFVKPLRITALKKIDPRIHWERTRNIDASIDYCQKDKRVQTNMLLPDYEKEAAIDWKPWQLAIFALCETVADDRTINWFWSPQGKIGKTWVFKYLVRRYNALIIEGKKCDIFHRFAARQDEGVATTIATMNIPKCKLDWSVPYYALECIKDGVIASGKYQGGQWLIPPVHVVIFSNREPDYEMMSDDRWNVVRLPQEARPASRLRQERAAVAPSASRRR